MSSIDNRIVSMEFDNKKFEKGISTSIQSLETLKKGLKLDGATSGLENIDKASRGIKFATISDGLETVTMKFSALGIIAVSVLQNITNSLFNAGKQLVSSLTIDPVIEGFHEYELKMDSVQNIMNGTGESLDRVSKKLDELNTYADRTIYSFSDMTSNIGKFTNAGVNLDDATGAIQGVANAAALSGSSSAQASHAMYNFAQALAAGHVKLIDWKSIETANMATVEFKQQLLDSAVAAGTLQKSADGMYTVLTKNGSGTNMKETISATQNFNDSLAYQWMTTEVLVGTLNDYADETTDIGKRAFKAATEVKTFTQLIDTMQEAVGSGWAETWEIVIGNFDEAKEVLTEISQAFESFIDVSTNARNSMLESWKSLGGRQAIIDGLRNAVQALAMVIKPVKEAFRDIFPKTTAKQLADASKNFRDFTESLKISDKTSDNLKSTFKGLFAIVDIGKEAFFALAKAVGEIIKYFLPVGDGVLDITGSFGEFIVSIRDMIKETDIFNKVFETLGKIVKPIADVVKKSIDAIADAIGGFKNVDTKGIDDLGDKLETGFKPFTAVAKIVKGSFEIISKVIEKAAPIFAGLGKAIGKGLGAAQKGIMDWLNNVDFTKGLDIFNAGMFGAVMLGIKKFIDGLSDVTENAGGIVEGIKDILGGITGTFEALQSRLKADVLMKIATAIAVLTGSIVVLSMLDADQIALSLTAIAILFTELFTAIGIFEMATAGNKFTGLAKVAGAMVAISVAVLILAGAMKTLSDLDWAGIGKGLVGITVILGELILAVNLMPNQGKLMKGASGLIFFALAINILASTVKKLGEVDTAELAKGLIGVGVLLTELSIFLNMTDMDGIGVFKGAGLVIFAGSLVILSKAVKTLGELDTGAMIQGLIGLGLVMAEIGIFLNMTGDANRMMTTAIGLTILAGAMVILAGAIESMGGMSWSEIAKGLTTMAGALTIMSLALHAIQGGLAGAAALVIVAGALAILVPVLSALGNMTWSEIATGLIVMAGSFTVLGVAASLLTPVIPSLYGLAGAITLLAVAIALIGGGVLALSAGLTALGVAGAAGVGALVLAITGIIGLIPMFLQQVANGLLGFIRVFADGIPLIVDAITKIIVAISQAIQNAVPEVVKTITVFLETMLKAIVEFVPKLVDGGMQLILGILKGISDHIGQVVETAIEIVVNFINGITNKIPDVIQAGVDLILAFINGLADAISNNTDTLISAMDKLMTAIIVAGIKTLTNSLGKFKDIGEKIIKSGFVQGIKNKFVDIVDTIKQIPSTIVTTIAGHMSDFLSIGSDIIGGIVKGISGGIGRVIDAAKDVAKGAIDGAKNFLKIRSPSKVFETEIGGNIGAGMVKGMKGKVTDVSKAGETLGKGAMAGTAKGIEAGASDVVNATAKVESMTFEETKEWIDKRRKYSELSLADEYSKWEDIQNKYKSGSEERLEIDRRMSDIKKQIARDEFENSKNWIDQEKFYKRLSLAEEIEAWERVQARYAKGTEERKAAERELFTLRNEMIRRQEEIDQEYLTAVENRMKALANAYGLFDEVRRSEELVQGEVLLQNLRDQVNAFEIWQEQITNLARKGIDEGLLQELRDMGPKALEQIQALNMLSSSELTEYVDLWQSKHRLAKEQATSELQGLYQETQQKILDLTKGTDVELEKFKTTWFTKTTELRKGVNTETEIMRTNSVASTIGMKYEMLATIDELIHAIIDAFESVDWHSIGRNIMSGIINGMRREIEVLYHEVDGIAEGTTQRLEDYYEIRSPSRRFARIGKQLVQGLAVGIKDFTGVAKDAAVKMGADTMNAASTAMSGLMDVFTSDINTPRIYPVLDLSNIEKDARKLDGLLGNGKSISVDKAKSVTSRTSQDSPGANDISGKEQSVSFVQNNYSPKALSRVDIYRQTKNQISSMREVLNTI